MNAKHPFRSVIYGGLASAAADAATTPFDVLKVRMQLQGEVGSQREYRNALDAVVKIARSEGPLAFFKGVQPTVVRQLSYGSLRFGLYAEFKSLFGVPLDSSQASPLRKSFAGMASGGLAAVVCNPIDLIKVRMQADGMRPIQSAPPSYTGIVDAARSIVRHEGALGLYKGVVPTGVRASVVCAAEIAGYDEIKCVVMRQGWMSEGIFLHFSVAMLSGLLSSAVSSPFDVVKSRVMSQTFNASGEGTRYSGMLDCFRKSIQAEGWSFAWKGFLPCYLSRAQPSFCCSFCTNSCKE
eukprot:TRINITY_DN9538_c0_g2_i1.p1 TRINITY_DN9538_c0_g2~~TRINITY_DN9538_c0_g2_i1.p1  ORF type:complete len:295 (-),score=26.23 TRINITY_DN9538_c0_g2_i1:193-1077(-)